MSETSTEKGTETELFRPLNLPPAKRIQVDHFFAILFFSRKKKKAPHQLIQMRILGWGDWGQQVYADTVYVLFL